MCSEMSLQVQLPRTMSCAYHGRPTNAARSKGRRLSNPGGGHVVFQSGFACKKVIDSYHAGAYNDLQDSCEVSCEWRMALLWPCHGADSRVNLHGGACLHAAFLHQETQCLHCRLTVSRHGMRACRTAAGAAGAPLGAGAAPAPSSLYAAPPPCKVCTPWAAPLPALPPAACPLPAWVPAEGCSCEPRAAVPWPTAADGSALRPPSMAPGPYRLVLAGWRSRAGSATRAKLLLPAAATALRGCCAAGTGAAAARAGAAAGAAASGAAAGLP